jgi:hypothetical protein
MVGLIGIKEGGEHGKAATFCLPMCARGDFGRKCPAATLDDGDASLRRSTPDEAGEEPCEIATSGSREMY